MSTSVTAQKARQLLLASMTRMPSEHVKLEDALGRTLARDLAAGCDVPRTASALVDGYAVIADDTTRAERDHPAVLSILSESGDIASKKLLSGTAVPVTAGGPIPGNADAVVRKSDAYRPEGTPELNVFVSLRNGANVREAGSAAACGDVICEVGTVLTAAKIGAAAGLGCREAIVSTSPRVAILATGSPDVAYPARVLLESLLVESGCVPVGLDPPAGKLEPCPVFAQAEGCAMLLLVLHPGARMDAVTAQLSAVGRLLFGRVGISPCGGTAAGLVGETLVMVLQSQWAIEIHEALARPALMAALGRLSLDRPMLTAKMTRAFQPDPAYFHYLRSKLEWDPERLMVTPIGDTTPSIPLWTPPDSMILIPDGSELIRRADAVDVIDIRPGSPSFGSYRHT